MDRVWKSRLAALGMVNVVALGAFAVPASAEGSLMSSMDGWSTGMGTPRWQDNDSDSVATTATLSGCRVDGATFRNVTLALYRREVGGVEESVGERTQGCSTFSWGHVGAGQYRIVLKKINGSSTGKLDVDRMIIRF